jgi:hypothetical protein
MTSVSPDPEPIAGEITEDGVLDVDPEQELGGSIRT